MEADSENALSVQIITAFYLAEFEAHGEYLVCNEIHPVSCIAQSKASIWLYCNLFNYTARSSSLNYSSIIGMCFQMSEECQPNGVVVGKKHLLVLL